MPGAQVVSCGIVPKRRMGVVEGVEEGVVGVEEAGGDVSFGKRGLWETVPSLGPWRMAWKLSASARAGEKARRTRREMDVYIALRCESGEGRYG